MSLGRLLPALLTVAAAAAATASPAGAASCDPLLVDSGGYDWDLREDSSVLDGENDAYGSYQLMSLYQSGTETGGPYPNAVANSCGREDDGREVTYPARLITDAPTGVTVARKIYVPATGKAFARWLTILTNTTNSPVEVSFDIYGDYGQIDAVTADEDGDGQISVGERWGVFRHDGGTSVASLWSGPDADDWDRVYPGGNYVPDVGSTTFDYVWDGVPIPAGEQRVFMQIEHQNNSADGAAAFATSFADGDDEFYAGMTDAELAALQNWTGPDRDGDGAALRVDNCPKDANADQADLDGDGLGDVCDDDIDGDGLSNALEGGLGTDPRRSDSDGDGVADGLDQCAVRAGAERGCPAAGPSGPPGPTGPAVRPARLAPNRITLKVRRSRPGGALRLRSIGSVRLPAGLTPADACGAGAVIVLVRAGKNVVDTRVADLAADCTFRATTTLRGLKRFGRRTLRVQARFTGNDRLTRRSSARVSGGRALRG